MTVSKIIDKVKRLKPNALTEEDIIDFVNEVEVDIAINIMGNHSVVLASAENKSLELLAPKLYERIYFDYILAKIDFLNGDSNFYPLTSQQYNMTYGALEAYCIRAGIADLYSEKRKDYF